MKTFNSKLIFLLAAFSIMGVGCGKSNNSGSTTYQPTVINDGRDVPVSPDGSGSTGGGATGAQTVAFTPVSQNEFNSYVGLHPLNAPTDYRLTVSLSDAGNGRFAGNVKISYYDTGVYYAGNFEAGSGTNVSMSGMKDNGMMEAEYNRWFQLSDGKFYFSAYFQDNYGAIVLVFDKYVTTGASGDAQGGVAVVSGSVYYKNFAQSYAPQSPYRKCWFVREGPYACRSSAVMDKSSAIPGDGYRKLGTFTNLNKASAFNE